MVSYSFNRWCYPHMETLEGAAYQRNPTPLPVLREEGETECVATSLMRGTRAAVQCTNKCSN